MGTFYRAVELKEFKENDFNLNVTLYVYPEEETEEIDVAREWEELRGFAEELAEFEDKIENYLIELKSLR